MFDQQPENAENTQGDFPTKSRQPRGATSRECVHQMPVLCREHNTMYVTQQRTYTQSHTNTKESEFK